MCGAGRLPVCVGSLMGSWCRDGQHGLVWEAEAALSSWVGSSLAGLVALMLAPPPLVRALYQVVQLALSALRVMADSNADAKLKEQVGVAGCFEGEGLVGGAWFAWSFSHMPPCTCVLTQAVSTQTLLSNMHCLTLPNQTITLRACHSRWHACPMTLWAPAWTTARRTCPPSRCVCVCGGG